jgi:hypothetical protein
MMMQKKQPQIKHTVKNCTKNCISNST